MTPSTAWVVVTSHTPPRGEEPLLVEALRRVGARTVTREGERFAGYFPTPGNVEVLLARTEAAIRASTSLTDPALAWRMAEAGDWERLWGADAMAPHSITDRLTVTGVTAGEPASPPRPGVDDAVPIRLRPGPFFGSAEHPTTRRCLQCLDALVQPGARILDVGSGSGILAIAAALLGAEKVLALEADSAACVAARDNAELNGVEGRVEVGSVRADSALLRSLGTFDGTLANIEPEGLLPLVPGLASAVGPSGWLLVSGVPHEDRDLIVDVAKREAARVDQEFIDEGWWTGVLR